MTNALLKLEKSYIDDSENNSVDLISLNFRISTDVKQKEFLTNCSDLISDQKFMLESLQYSNDEEFYLDVSPSKSHNNMISIDEPCYQCNDDNTVRDRFESTCTTYYNDNFWNEDAKYCGRHDTDTFTAADACCVCSGRISGLG
jgi:hypothetical protein